jgi:hypothetical protein
MGALQKSVRSLAYPKNLAKLYQDLQWLSLQSVAGQPYMSEPLQDADKLRKTWQRQEETKGELLQLQHPHSCEARDK